MIENNLKLNLKFNNLNYFEFFVFKKSKFKRIQYPETAIKGISMSENLMGNAENMYPFKLNGTIYWFFFFVILHETHS